MMKKIFYNVLCTVVVALLAACNNDKEEVVNRGQVVAFVTSISNTGVAESRVTGSTWEKSDRVGIFMTPTGKTDAGANANVCYIPNNVVMPDTLNGGFALSYPTDGTAVDFFAYYPYNQNMTSDGKINFDFTNQSTLKDVLVASSIGKKEGDVVALAFTHVLAKVQFNMTSIQYLTNVDWTKSYLQIDNMAQKGTLSLMDATPWSTSASGVIKLSPSPITIGTDNTYCFKALLMPAASFDLKITLVLNDANGNVVLTRTSDTANTVWKAGNSYTYNLKLPTT